MVARASERLEGADIRQYVAGSGGVTKGMAVKLASGLVVAVSAIADNAIGVARATVLEGEKVEVVHFGYGIVKMKVGTGGLVEGLPAKYAADGVIAATVGTGTNKLVVYGQSVETGVAGDYIGVNLGMACFTVGA